MANVILVGVDGSKTARDAARTAAEVAAGSGAKLYVCTAFGTPDDESSTADASLMLNSPADAAEGIARRAADELRSVVPDVESIHIYGKPAEALIEEAVRLDARLIVVGNKRMQGVTRVLGSVANSVSHNAPCDVYIVKTH